MTQQQRNRTMSVAGLVAAVGLGVVDRGVFLASRSAGWVLGGLFIAVPAFCVAYNALREQ